jgi:hypothetical protein
MHPALTWSLSCQHRDEMEARARRYRAGRRPRAPRWRISWTRATLSAGPGEGAGGQGRPIMSWVIIISASRLG